MSSIVMLSVKRICGKRWKILPWTAFAFLVAYLHKRNHRDFQCWNFSFRFVFAWWIQFHRRAREAAILWQICGLWDLYLCYSCRRCRLCVWKIENWIIDESGKTSNTKRKAWRAGAVSVGDVTMRWYLNLSEKHPRITKLSTASLTATLFYPLIHRAPHLKHGSFRINNWAPPSDFFIRILSMIQWSASRFVFFSNSITMYACDVKWRGEG